MSREITRFQFETIKDQLAKGNDNWIDLRRSCGLTNEELIEIVNNLAYYESKFLPKEEEEPPKKKHWWQRGRS